MRKEGAYVPINQQTRHRNSVEANYGLPRTFGKRCAGVFRSGMRAERIAVLFVNTFELQVQ